MKHQQIPENALLNPVLVAADFDRSFSDHHLSGHASKRRQQRCISPETLTLLQMFGRKVYDHQGGYRLMFDRRGRQRVHLALGKAAAQLKLNVYAVFGTTKCDQVVTVGHRTKRIKTKGVA